MEENALLRAAGKSCSLALLPLLVSSLDTGMRASEVRSLRRHDLTLEWDKGVMARGGSPRSQEQDGSRDRPNDSFDAEGLRDPNSAAVALPWCGPRFIHVSTALRGNLWQFAGLAGVEFRFNQTDGKVEECVGCRV